MTSHVPYLKQSDFEAFSHISHAFFTRHLSPSTHSYYQRFENDTEENIANNHSSALRYFNSKIPKLSVAKQVHGTAIKLVDSIESALTVPEADAQVTNLPNIPLAVLTADCTPILLADPHNNVIGSIHAGWKGAKKGIISSTIAAMQSIGASINHIRAALGPTIHPESYEVSTSFKSDFLNDNPCNERFFFNAKREGHAMFDLPAYVTASLEDAGINYIYNISMDTFANENLFFSYRRNCLRQEQYYRNLLSVIMINEK